MWLFTAKRLLRFYGDKRLYVTDLHNDRFAKPNRMYLFLSEYGTEIELKLESVKLKKRIHSKDSVLFKVQVLNGPTLLLLVDNRRGNHYVYCREDAYRVIVRTSIETAFSQTAGALPGRNEAAAAFSEVPPLSADELNNRILFIDTHFLSVYYSDLERWIATNELILSPYFAIELERFVSDPNRLHAILTEIYRLGRAFEGNISTDLKANLETGSFLYRDLSDESDYLLILAQQMPVTSSQIVFITMNEEWAATVRAHGFQVLLPYGSANRVEFPEPTHQTGRSDHAILIEALPVEYTADEGLPPRSERQRTQLKNGEQLKKVSQIIRSLLP